ncbi:lytic transglycosylase domain-containing protein [Rhodosalinus halophilus]|uniref:Lytic transglycosylase domain-containing protein n=1 Tax=Rhodosalinus halophilus TaxID=2259333 RepID=A0A365UA53_9RHOB|nr:transglycosylase SLT domain-containing protein [Rhodosalinus halophilus]RBI85849.1 lytic transglycosylase domain-containing protein [Rhodosalinus halophilus]
MQAVTDGIRRLSGLVLLIFVLVMMLSQPATARPLGEAMDAIRGGDWARAADRAAQEGPVAADIVEWHRLRDGRGAAADVVAFLARNPDWPGLDWLRRRSEPAIAEADDETIRAFFEEELPQTGEGALAFAEALEAAGETGAAQAGLVLAWRTLPLSEAEHAAFLSDHGELLAPHHTARLDMALWREWEDNARAMLLLVSEGWQKLAEARIALNADAAGVDARIEAVPAALADHPGLAYERFAWRLRRGRDDDAAELLLDRSASAERLGEPAVWAGPRRTLARRLMQDGRHALAYRVAASHFTLPAAGYVHAELEWIAGYLALRHLERPETAVQHFERFAAAVDTPISRGRAGYWLGRAHEAAGEAEAAQAAYAMGARYQSSFYGLLAAERGGLPFDATLAGRDPAPDWRDAPFTDSSVYRAGVLLLAAGERTLGERFLTHLAESLDEADLARLGAMLDEMGEPHVAVMVGKRAARRGLTVPAPYYALHPMAEARWPVPAELALAIARRESEFDPRVVSAAGARGLMQVMPGTAREVAGRLGLGYDHDRLLTDWTYNAQLGTAYLAELMERFEGNPVLVAAAYNAGPSRPIRWMQELGDPRDPDVDVVDWIESIPFAETRNYVMRVTESLPVYRARLGRAPHPVLFTEELKGSILRGG